MRKLSQQIIEPVPVKMRKPSAMVSQDVNWLSVLYSGHPMDMDELHLLICPKLMTPDFVI
jgi:hypothetical protein